MPSSANSSNQTNLTRRLDGTYQAPLLDDNNAEEYAKAFANERNRIREERQAQLQAEADAHSTENNSTVKEIQKQSQDHLENSLLSRITPHWAQPIVDFAEQIQENPGGDSTPSDRLRDAITATSVDSALALLLPAWASPVSPIIQFAEQNRLAGQSLLLGLPDTLTPQLQGDIPDSALPDPVLPPPQTPPASNDQWEGFGRAYAGKTLTLAWSETSWVSGLTVKPREGHLDQLSYRPITDLYALTGTFIRNIYGYGYAPWMEANIIAGSYLTEQVGLYGQKPELYYLYYGGKGNLQPGWVDAVPAPDYRDVAFSSDQYLDNFLYGGDYYATGYRPVARVNTVQKFNTQNGEVVFFNLTINHRKDIRIGDSGDWENRYTGSLGSWKYTGFFESPGAGLFSLSQVTPFRWSQGNLGVGGLLCYPKIVNFDSILPPPKKTPPPPKPPDRKCDCMANCCPQNSQDLSDLRRLLLSVIETQKKQQKLLGLDNLPYSVDVNSDNKFTDLLKNTSKQNPLLGKIASSWAGNVSPLGQLPAINIEDITSLIAFLAIEKNNNQDYIGEPVDITLWDLNSKTPGNHTQTITPKTLFKAIEAIANEITLTQRIIGIDKLPAKVPRKWVHADNTHDMMTEAAKALGVPSQFEFLKQLVGIKDDQTEITSLVEFLDWQSDQIDDVFGHWEIDVVIADGDLIKPGDQGTTAHVLNIAQAMQKTIEASMSSNISEKAIINMLARVLVELQGMKQEIGKSSSQVNAIRHYLGFPTKPKVVKVPAHCNIPKQDKEKPDDLTLVNDLSTFLQGCALPIETEVYEDTKTIQDILIDLQQAAAITRATGYQKVGSEDDMNKIIGGLATAYGLLKKPIDPNAPQSDPDSFEAFLTQVENDFSDTAGRVSDSPGSPYGKPPENKPLIREIGNNAKAVPDS